MNHRVPWLRLGRVLLAGLILLLPLFSFGGPWARELETLILNRRLLVAVLTETEEGAAIGRRIIGRPIGEGRDVTAMLDAVTEQEAVELLSRLEMIDAEITRLRPTRFAERELQYVRGFAQRYLRLAEAEAGVLRIEFLPPPEPGSYASIARTREEFLAPAPEYVPPPRPAADLPLPPTFDFGNTTVRMTTREATRVANYLGYAGPIRPAPFNAKGQPVYRDGNTYLTPDITGHGGYGWKVFEGAGNNIVRTGTWTRDLSVRLRD